MAVYTDAGRDGCLWKGKPRTYAYMQRECRCNECCGRVVIMPPADGEGWHPVCGRCNSRDFEHEAMLDRQKSEAVEVLNGLPAELAALA